MIGVEIDDRQITEFFKKSPKRAEWAMKEALSMAGGHFRNKLRAYIESGGQGWPGLHPATRAGKGYKGGTPLHGMGRFVRFQVGKVKGVMTASIGWVKGKGGQALSAKTLKGIRKVGRISETGKRIKITSGLRYVFIRRGFPLRPETKQLQIPKRPMIEWLWNIIKREAGPYIEKRFFEKFFSKGV